MPRYRNPRDYVDLGVGNVFRSEKIPMDFVEFRESLRKNEKKGEKRVLRGEKRDVKQKKRGAAIGRLLNVK